MVDYILLGRCAKDGVGEHRLFPFPQIDIECNGTIRRKGRETDRQRKGWQGLIGGKIRKID